MLCRAKASSVSQVELDAATVSVLFFLTGGVSFCSGVDAPEVRWVNRRLHRRHSFTRLLTLPLGVISDTLYGLRCTARRPRSTSPPLPCNSYSSSLLSIEKMPLILRSRGYASRAPSTTASRRCGVGNLQAHAVTPSAAAAGGCVTPAQDGQVQHAHDNVATGLEGDQVGPVREPSEEIPSSVDGR